MDKTVVITGASRGIGRETAKFFAYEGFNVVINYLNSKLKAEKLAAELTSGHHSAIAIQADISEPQAVVDMFKSVEDLFGKIDVLVNNAGVAEEKLLIETEFEDWKRLFAVNVEGTFHCCKAVLPNMLRRHSGKIINISSIWGMCGASCETAYSASKAAIIGFTKALAKEVGPSSIQVNCVAPGVIDTDMNADCEKAILDALKAKTPLRSLGTVADIANTILFLASSKADFITGQVISPNGGYVI
ncbi:MAG: 3-oxoacyl-ACP reductase FabG [Oscillospiraceae bacterium]|jgi:3-oxoacyl-[acyl-carrier protein] reductase|nr:3-oxoacyl-ACP reductase FabG [Oscillospiraceae bacterium]